MRVSEMFYSLQGEGARAGEPSVFVRLQGCSAKHACYASGVRCDTEFESGTEMHVDEIRSRAAKLIADAGGPVGKVDPKPWLIWTGGEPLDQLTIDVARVFSVDWRQSLETSGVRPLSRELHEVLDYIVVSPKVAEHVLEKHFDGQIEELRYVRHVGQQIPVPSLEAEHYCLSPHSDGATINQENLAHCIKLCLAHPQWRLSVQQHKVWRVL